MKMWLSDLSIRQPVFITMLVAAVLVSGGLFYSRMAMDLLPDVSIPVVAVRTIYPGADPQEVERSITRPIEDEVVSLNGVENVRSTSLDSVSTVIVEFKLEMDAKAAEDEVRTRVNALRNSFPADAREPLIEKMDFSAAAMMTVAMADGSGRRTPEQLRALADDSIKPRLERINGVASAEVSGGRVREVHVDLKLDRLKAYGLPPQQVVQAIRGENVDIPGGRISDGGAEELVRTAGRVRSLGELGEISVSTPRGASAKLKELADLTEGHADVRALSRLNGQDSVVIAVRKQSGTNLVQVAEGVKAELERLRHQYPDVSFGIATDQSTFTRQSVQDVQLSLLLGGLLAAAVVFLFFRDLRNTLVTVAGLPVVVFGTFGVLYAFGITLNTVTLMALSISIGMLIDDAIVVRENIFRHMERGEEPKQAAGRGTAEIAMAVVAVTSTIVAVFLPIAFTGGIVGKFLREFGLTVVVAVLISLVEAFTFAPMLSAYFFRRRSGIGGQGAGSGDAGTRRRGDAEKDGFPLPMGEGQGEGTHHSSLITHHSDARRLSLNGAYRGLLSWALRHRILVVGAGLVTLVASLAPIPFMSRSFLPVLDQGEFGITLEMRPGTRLEDTDRAARAAEQVLLAEPEVAQSFGSIGATDGSVDRATFRVKLRSLGRTDEVVERLRPQLVAAVPDARVQIEKQATTALFTSGSVIGSARGRPIQFSLEGADLEDLRRVSAEMMARLQQVPGITDVDSTLKAGRPERLITVDRNRASDLGVSTAQLGSTVRVLVNGEVAGSFRAADKDVDIVVRLAEADRDNPEKLLQIPIVTARGGQLPLSAVAVAAPSTEPNRIDRQNRQRQVVVGAGFTGRDMGTVLAQARAAVASVPLPEGMVLKLSGDSKYMDEAFTSLNLAILLSVVFVYMILASQFGSFIHPFTIMLALPFSVVGALLSLVAARFSLDMLAMIGMILLMGLVTKNSILLVEFTNQLRRRGLTVHEAILEAGPLRLRPILMTTLAMIFGMLPVAAGFGAGSELRQPMGISVIGGLITSTMLTLVVVPVSYSLIDGAGRRLARRFRGAPASPSGPEGRDLLGDPEAAS